MLALGDTWSQGQETRSPRGVFALSVLFVFQNLVIDALSQCKKICFPFICFLIWKENKITMKTPTIL